MNGEYIKKMDADEFYERALPYMKEVLKKDYNFKKIAGMVPVSYTHLDVYKRQVKKAPLLTSQNN